MSASRPECMHGYTHVYAGNRRSSTRGWLLGRAPSDSPDDWRALEDLRSEAKAKYYGLDLETMIAPFKVP